MDDFLYKKNIQILHRFQPLILLQLLSHIHSIRYALFEVRGGAKEYCSKSLLCCLKKTGFSNTLIMNNIKELYKSSIECSFCIWLARNNKEWIAVTTLTLCPIQNGGGQKDPPTCFYFLTFTNVELRPQNFKSTSKFQGHTQCQSQIIEINSRPPLPPSPLPPPTYSKKKVAFLVKSL